MTSSPPPSSSVWSDLPRRLTTISLGIPIILCVFSFPQTALLFFQGVHFLTCIEWIQLMPSTTSDKRRGSDYLFVVVSMAVAQLSDDMMSLGLIMGMTVLYLSTRNHHLVHGLMLITLPMHTWYQVASLSFTHTVTLLFIVWNCDTGALIAGRVRRILFPNAPPHKIAWLHSISPAKSLAGMWGGILLGTLTTLWIPAMWNACYVYLPKNQQEEWWLNSPWETWQHRALLGFALSALAILGDLVESAVKRQAGEKDTGKLLPGHGGILDRFDSSLLAIVAYRYICMTDE